MNGSNRTTTTTRATPASATDQSAKWPKLVMKKVVIEGLEVEEEQEMDVDDEATTASEDDDLWYACLVCHQAFEVEQQWTKHRQAQHNDHPSARVLVLSLQDLSPTIRIPPVQVRVKEVTGTATDRVSYYKPGPLAQKKKNYAGQLQRTMNRRSKANDEVDAESRDHDDTNPRRWKLRPRSKNNSYVLSSSSGDDNDDSSIEDEREDGHKLEDKSGGSSEETEDTGTGTTEENRSLESISEEDEELELNSGARKRRVRRLSSSSIDSSSSPERRQNAPFAEHGRSNKLVEPSAETGQETRLIMQVQIPAVHNSTRASMAGTAALDGSLVASHAGVLANVDGNSKAHLQNASIHRKSDLEHSGAGAWSGGSFGGEVICPVCWHRFKSRSQLRSHIETVHYGIPAPILCPQCGLRFATPKILRVHQRRAHRVKKEAFACKICDCIFICERNLARHKQRHHQPQRREQQQQQDKSEERVEIIYGDPRRLPCAHCDRRFRLASHLHMHMLKSHRDIDLEASYGGGFELELPVVPATPAEAEDSQRIPCGHCDRTFRLAHHLHMHMDKSHRGLTESREMESFGTEGVDEQSQEGYGNGGAVVGEDEIQLQMEVSCSSSGDDGRPRPFQCSTCGKGFMQATHLKTHLVSHTSPEQKRYHCSKCGKRFGLAHHLKQHSRTHGSHKRGFYT